MVVDVGNDLIALDIGFACNRVGYNGTDEWALCVKSQPIHASKTGNCQQYIYNRTSGHDGCAHSDALRIESRIARSGFHRSLVFVQQTHVPTQGY